MFPFKLTLPHSSSPRFPGMMFWWLPRSHSHLSILTRPKATELVIREHHAFLCPSLISQESLTRERTDILIPWPRKVPSKTWASPPVMKLRDIWRGLAWRYGSGHAGPSDSAYWDAPQTKTWLPMLKCYHSHSTAKFAHSHKDGSYSCYSDHLGANTGLPD